MTTEQLRSSILDRLEQHNFHIKKLESVKGLDTRSEQVPVLACIAELRWLLSILSETDPISDSVWILADRSSGEVYGNYAYLSENAALVAKGSLSSFDQSRVGPWGFTVKGAK